ncbi:carbamate kinase [Bacilli bacterium]|nr:carbamate kinase [Bacilli bacterium]
MIKIVISIGGNALSLNPRDDAVLLKPVAKLIVSLFKEGNKILLTAGNGPQSGELLECFVDANKQNSHHNILPLDEVDAISQGYIGYHVNKAIEADALNSNVKINTACISTLTIVDENDSGFLKPTKPIGCFYKTLDEAKAIYPNDPIIEDAGRGYRKVVASPKPISFMNIKSIKTCFDNGIVTITGIGGGVPCVISGKKLIPKEGVIDKDFSTAKLAISLESDILLIITSVPYVYIDFNKATQKPIKNITPIELEKLIKQYDFGKGSMEPKLLSAIEYVKTTNKIAIITDIENASEAINLKAGTIIKN